MLSSSTLGLIEVTATAARKCASGAIDAAGYAESRDWLLDEWSRFLWIGLMPEVVERSLKVADTYALRGSDSVRLASAPQRRDDLAINAGDFAMVTCDQELKSAALKAGLVVVDPQDQEHHRQK